MTLWRLFETAATRFADRVAVEVQRESGAVSWTYRELHRAALARSAWLNDRGVGAGDRCALLGDNDAAWCATFFGILRAGAIAVPLDTSCTPEQVAAFVRDAAPRVLFVSDRFLEGASAAAELQPGLMIASVHEPAAADGRAPAPPCEPPDGIAVILYTAGTTADPKGVVLTHANLTAARDGVMAAIPVSDTDSVLGVLPLFHSLALLANLLLPLTLGARVVFLETVSSAEVMRALREGQITVFACTPQALSMIREQVRRRAASSGWLQSRLFRKLLALSYELRRCGVNVGRWLFPAVDEVVGPSIHLFLTGGSKLDPAAGKDLYALGFIVLQAYGLAETSGAAALARPDEAHLGTVGRPLRGNEIRIVPAAAPDGDGEIAIRGPIVMQGYFGRPDATAEVLRDGWLLTGDLGRLDAEGRLTITGRRAEIVVLPAGKNVYPEEIEAQYLRSAFIKELCVVRRADPAGSSTERLHAVVVPDMDVMRTRRVVNVGDLVRFEIEGRSIHLPPHQRVLGYEIAFEPLPRTTAGQLKRHQIARRLKAGTLAPPPDAQVHDRGWAGDAHAEAVVAAIRRRARGGTIAASSNLELDVGLDSMDRVELIAEIEQRAGARIADADVACVLTVAQLIDATRPSGAASSAAAADDAWARMLGDLPAATDPVLSGMLTRRRLAAPIFFLATRLLRLLLPPVRASGREHLPSQGPYLICPNHQGYLDPFIVGSVLPFGVFRQLFFVGAAEYFDTPLTGWIARQCNCVPVDPDANLVPAMQAGAFGLRHGKVLMLFPEGERSIDGTVKRFKKGAAILSAQLGVPIVPVALRGAFELWPRNRAIGWRYLFPWNRHRVRVQFLPAIRLPSGADAGSGAAQLQAAVAAAWEKL